MTKNSPGYTKSAKYWRFQIGDWRFQIEDKTLNIVEKRETVGNKVGEEEKNREG